jgi:RNA recognition motif-containing protein
MGWGLRFCGKGAKAAGTGLHGEARSLNLYRERTKEVSMNIYVGNLSYDITEEDLKQTFEAFGEVASAKVIKDMYSGRSKGFGFVEMANNTEAQSAIDDLDGKELKGRTIKVNMARSRTDRGGRGGNRGGGRQGGGGGRRFY